MDNREREDGAFGQHRSACRVSVDDLGELRHGAGRPRRLRSGRTGTFSPLRRRAACQTAASGVAFRLCGTRETMLDRPVGDGEKIFHRAVSGGLARPALVTLIPAHADPGIGGKSVAASADTPRAVFGMVERRVAFSSAALLTGLAGAAWYLTVRQAGQMAGMVTGLGQVGGGMVNDVAVPLSLAMWLSMTIAMMFPAVVPMVLAHRTIVRKRGEGALARAHDS